MIEINKIYNEDCLVTMGKMQLKVNSIITSPPYNTGGRIEYYSPIKINNKRTLVSKQ